MTRRIPPTPPTTRRRLVASERIGVPAPARREARSAQSAPAQNARARCRTEAGGTPVGPGLARGHALLVQPPADRLDAPACDGVVPVDVAHDARFSLDDGVRGRCIVTLPEITIAIRGAAHDADLARSCAVPLAATRPFEDLGAFVLGDHALKLHQQLILGGSARRGVEEAGLDAVTAEFLDQQHLVGVLAAQPIRTVNEHDCDVAGGRQVTDPFQSRPFERRSAIPVVFEDEMHLPESVPGLSFTHVVDGRCPEAPSLPGRRPGRERVRSVGRMRGLRVRC